MATSKSAASSKAQQPLSGVRVLDLGRMIAGPYASQMLADYGADVIKIERAKVGDDSRQANMGCLLDEKGAKILGETSLFLLGNRSKRSVSVELSRPDGQQIIHQLAAVSDVLVENFVPGTAKRFNIDYETLSKINPRLIYCSVSGWGQTGPHALRPGYDASLQAATGFMSVTGQRDGMPGAGPTRVGASIVDISTGMNAAFAIVIALRHRDATGEGQYIDVGMFDSGIALQADNVQKFLLSGDNVGRHGTENYGGAPARVFKTRDHDIFLIASTNRQFASLCATLGRPDLSDDERFIDITSRFKHRDTLYGILEPLIASRTSAEILAGLDKAEVPCGAVNNYSMLFADPHTSARGTAVHADHPLSSRLSLIASPMKLSKTPAQYRRPPMLGEHTDEVLREILGIEDSELTRLRQEGVL